MLLSRLDLARIVGFGHVTLRLQMQPTMLIATKKLAFGSDTFTSGQMNAAMNAAHHVLTFN
jgi:hypothetical protein